MKNRLLGKLDLLQELVADDRGDEVIEDALDYILSYEKAKLGREIAMAREQISEFEKKYELSDREFLKLYEGGQLEDRREYLEWFALMSLEVSLRKKLSLAEKWLKGAREGRTGEEPGIQEAAAEHG